MCKSNDAAYVSQIMPHSRAAYVRDRGIIRISATTCVPALVDSLACEAYLYLRIMRARHGRAERPKEPSLGARRHTQSPSGSRSRSIVHRQSVFRSQGFGPGPLRDGAAPPRRWRLHQRCRRRLRRLSTDLLQSPECACRSRSAWACAASQGSQGRAQDFGRGRDLHHRSQSCPPRADNTAVPCRDRDAVQHQGASAQLGTRAGGQKKQLDPI